MSNVKRMGLYFNLDNPMERLMWDYLQSTRKKSDTVKNLIFKEATNSSIDIPVIKPEEIKVDVLKESDINDNDIPGM